MLFMLESVTRPGVTRDQVVQHLSDRLSPSTWDLIRNGTLSHVLYKTGTDAGFFAMLTTASIEDAEKLVNGAVDSLGLFDIRITPINQFPHFGD